MKLSGTEAGRGRDDPTALRGVEHLQPPAIRCALNVTIATAGVGSLVSTTTGICRILQVGVKVLFNSVELFRLRADRRRGGWPAR